MPPSAGTGPAFRLLYQLHVGVREGWIWARRFFWTEPLFRSQCAAVGRNGAGPRFLAARSRVLVFSCTV